MLGGLAAALAAAWVLALGAGSVGLSWSEVVGVLRSRILATAGSASGAVSQANDLIVWQVRLPRIALATVVGVALGGAGAVFQGLLRNPMADPYIIGVSPGAALGAAVAIAGGWQVRFGGVSALPLFAFAGALGATAVVYHISKVGGRGVAGVSVEVLLLAGVAVGAFLSALVSLLLVLKSETMDKVIFWLMGGFSGRGWEQAGVALPYVVLGLLVIARYREELNLLSLGDEAAYHLGVDTARVQKTLLAAASLAAASAVAVSGVIGFVGLIVPHLLRLAFGPDHRLLVPASALGGAVLLVLADTAARTALAPNEIPVGVVTALLGVPFFLFLLRRTRGGA